jgi:hypothetical protein
VCRSKPLSLSPLDVLDPGREGGSVGPVLQQLKRIQVGQYPFLSLEPGCEKCQMGAQPMGQSCHLTSMWVA